MRIKRLDLIGFKSFVDRTVLNFSAGVSAIVGPNGCGKSNIVDAIRWVLGEQSPKHLRGSAMEDVVFNGNERRAPLGMAEVSLTFENEPLESALTSDPDLDVSTLPAHVRGLPEITVTRRYYRSGESEYFINRTACRLKDITELFLGTGIGSKAYAIIEQGRVEQLISAKPEDRRLFIEEAAGTTLYRSRKLAAERKMERTRENLARVNDILREVERQIQYLNRQAKKAEQYRNLQAEIRELELSLARAQWRGLSDEMAAIRASLDELAAEEARLTNELHAADEARQSARNTVSEAEHRLGARREDAARATAELEAHNERATRLQQELAERERRLERFAEELAAIVRRQASLAADSQQVAAEQRTNADALMAEEAGLAVKAGEVEERRGAAEAAERQVESTKDRLVGLLAREAEARNQIAGLVRRADERARRRERLDRESEDVVRQLAGLDESAGVRREELAAHRQRLQELRGEREVRARQLLQIAEEQSAAQGRLQSSQEELLRLRSRLQSIIEIQQNYEGYQRGVRAVMRRRQQGAEPAHAGHVGAGEGIAAAQASGGGVAAWSADNGVGVLGVVADVITAPREYERAVAAVLGERLQYVIVGGAEDAIDAVRTLRSEEGGRSSFIPRSPRRIALNASVPSLNGNSVRLLDLVRVTDGYRDVAETLLGDVVLVNDLPTALALWNRNGIHVTMVTRDGDVIDAYGVITGGSDRPLEEEILGRRREIEELESSVAAFGAEVERAGDTLAQAGMQQAAEESALRQLDAGVHELTLAALTAEKDCERLDAERPRLLDRLEVVRHERAGLASEEAESAREGEAQERVLAESAEERALVETNLQSQQQGFAAVKADVASLAEALTAAKVRAAECRERQSALRLRADELQRQIAELGERGERLHLEQAETRQHRASIEQDLEAARAAAATIAQRADDLASTIAVAAREVAAAEEEARRIDASADALRETIDTGRQRRVGQETALAERRVRIEHLEGNMREKYDADVAATARAEGESGEAASFTDDWLAERHGRLDHLRERLHRIGEVNPGAIEELQELETRAQFLRTQKEDLERSLIDLEHTITKLNKASKMRFLETFEKADAQFRALMPRLFRGGEARLVLTDESNILESGVEIFVRPPGKKLDTVTLLSGGEKALVAVSLIFSLFLISPTPFCLLDEVDAPLDDANVGRFVQLVREMRERSQFIVITHNKRTMEAADCLYGITMEEPGVSKVIAVAMH